MAIYDNLEVFKASYDLLLYVFQFTPNVKRDYRYTLAEKIKDNIIELCLCIYRANGAKDRVPDIRQARERLVTIKLMCRMLTDLKQISVRQFAVVCTHTESISRQLQAWQRYSEKVKAEQQAAAVPHA
ncbi:four helix bundle protein [Rikenella microfusus]|uniref:four helix bundle protein n=1 Tax=Rikenella microfusus TaxID=28139 RepID=UPI003A90990E